MPVRPCASTILRAALLCSWALLGAATSSAADEQREPYLGAQPRSEVVAGWVSTLELDPDDLATRKLIKQTLMRPDVTRKEMTAGVRELLRQTAPERRTSLVRDDEPGEPLLIGGRVLTPEGRAIKQALIYAFQADAEGRYTPWGAMDESQARLFGFARPDADGRFDLRSIVPGHYPEREDVEGDARFIPRHIHFEVSAPGYRTRRFQMVFHDDPRMTVYWYRWADQGGNIVARPQRTDPRRVSQSIVLEHDR